MSVISNILKSELDDFILENQIRDLLIEEAQTITDSEVRVCVTTWLAIKVGSDLS